MSKIIIEVGSTVTKIDLLDENKLKRLKTITIFFKKNYQELGHILESDLDKLISEINQIKEVSEDIYLCGTSIFRSLSEEEKKQVLDKIKTETKLLFHIIEAEEESRLTVLGTTRFVSSKVGVFIGGGGSTEIAIYDGKIIDSSNTSIGVIDVTKQFPDLAEDIAKTSLDDVMEYIRANLVLPKEKADILILAGGGHEKFARESGIWYEENSKYQDPCAPIGMPIERRKEETKRYFESISLDEIRKKSDDASWWYATRAMCAFVLVVAEAIGAKYIVPTDIGMAYGIMKEEK